MKVKVRIAVAVDPTGAWHAEGSDEYTDEKALFQATKGLRLGSARYWLEAELEVPETRTIAPTVTPA